MVRVFANGPGDLGSIPGIVIPKTQKMVLEAVLLNTQHYKARIKGKVGQSWEGSSALPYTLVLLLSKRSPRVTLDYGRQLFLSQYLLSLFSFANISFFHLYAFTNYSAQPGCDTRSIF